MGERELKNIDRPVRVWRWVADRGMDVRGPENPDAPLPLSDKPSIAVLPFDNISGDPEQEYFADGITEDIITTLSKIPDLFVIARISTFNYKGTAIDVKQAAQDLGVRYVVEGSVRKAGQGVRIPGPWRLEIVKRRPDAQGFEVLPKRWIVEWALGWLVRRWRLRVDHEGRPDSSEALIKIAISHLILNRLQPA